MYAGTEQPRWTVDRFSLEEIMNEECRWMRSQDPEIPPHPLQLKPDNKKGTWKPAPFFSTTLGKLASKNWHQANSHPHHHVPLSGIQGIEIKRKLQATLPEPDFVYSSPVDGHESSGTLPGLLNRSRLNESSPLLSPTAWVGRSCGSSIVTWLPSGNQIIEE
jgi:hypothetical protein